jgi:hypothetical protein
MVLTQQGAQVTGTYDFNGGRIVGTVNGRTLTGTWTEEPTRQPPDLAGDMELTLSDDGMSFTGRWRFGSDGGWGDWTGARTQ